MPKIILTGGGTAGHVTPNIALLPRLKEEGFEILYVGSYDGIERKLSRKKEFPTAVSPQENCAGIST